MSFRSVPDVFLLFGGQDFYPNGGWGDFLGSFPTPYEALAEIGSRDGLDWWHVVDTTTDSAILTSHPDGRIGVWNDAPRIALPTPKEGSP